MKTTSYAFAVAASIQLVNISMLRVSAKLIIHRRRTGSRKMNCWPNWPKWQEIPARKYVYTQPLPTVALVLRK